MEVLCFQHTLRFSPSSVDTFEALCFKFSLKKVVSRSKFPLLLWAYYSILILFFGHYRVVKVYSLAVFKMSQHHEIAYSAVSILSTGQNWWLNSFPNMWPSMRLFPSWDELGLDFSRSITTKLALQRSNCHANLWPSGAIVLFLNQHLWASLPFLRRVRWTRPHWLPQSKHKWRYMDVTQNRGSSVSALVSSVNIVAASAFNGNRERDRSMQTMSSSSPTDQVRVRISCSTL